MNKNQIYFPQFFPSTWEKEHAIYGIPFTKDVSIGFVVRENGFYSYLSKDNFITLGSSDSALITSALNSLANLDEGVQVRVVRPPGATVIWIEANDNFAAVRLLLPNFQSLLKKARRKEFCQISFRNDELRAKFRQ